jgi:hypothetical protein
MMPAYVQHFIDLFSQSPPAMGVSDIFACESRDSAARAGAFALVMNFAQSKNDDHPVHKTFVIAPPLGVTPDLGGEAVRLSVIKAAEAHFGRTLTDREKAAINDQVKTVHTPDLRISSVVKALEWVTGNSAAIILYAASYRSEDVATSPGPNVPATLPEDVWVPHLAHV